MRSLIVAAAFAIVAPAVAPAQDTANNVDTRSVGLSGPRFGMTFLNGALRDSLKSKFDARSPISQFGWQFETQIFRVDDGLRGLTEFVILVGGLDQGIVIPTATWLVGLRGASGMELGVGPSASPAGVGLAVAAGISFKRGGVNFPLNVAIVSGSGGQRMSVLTGFNVKR